MVKKLRAVLIAFLLALVGVGVFAACSSTKNLADAELTLSQYTYVFEEDTEHRPDVTVTYKGKEVSHSDIAVIYENNKNAGTATVTVTPAPKSSYKGSISANFTITQAEVANKLGDITLTAVYKQKLGDVLVENGINIHSSEDNLTEDTVLTEMGEKAYTFKSLYTPSDTNYLPYERTVYVTVNKAQPDGVKELDGLTAELGSSYSDLELPEGIELMAGEAGKTFEKAGATEIKVKAYQVDETTGQHDTVHYEEIENLTATVNVAKGEYQLFEGYDKLKYDSTALQAGSAANTHTVNGDVVLEGDFYLHKNWEFTIVLARDGLKRINLNIGFDNVLADSMKTDGSKTLLQDSTNKKTEFNFETGKSTSWLGSAKTTYNYDDDEANATKKGSAGNTDNAWIPERVMNATGNIKIIVKAGFDTATIDTRTYYIYIGLENDTIESGMTQLFYRSTTKKYPVRITDLTISTSKQVTINSATMTETNYVADKLVGASKMQMFMEGGQIADKYKNGGLLMIGDSLVDYWAINMGGGSTAAVTATQEMFADFGYKGPVINLGIGSATAENWLNYLESPYFEEFNPEAVFILIGCNQYSDEDELNISKYITLVAEKVRELYGDAKIVVNSLMPVTATSATRYAHRSRLENANVLVENWIETEGDENMIFLDVQSIFSPDPTKPLSADNMPLQDAGYYHTDGLHFLKAAYELWTPKVIEAITEHTEIKLEVKVGEETLPNSVMNFSYTAYNGYVVLKLSLKEMTNGITYDVVTIEIDGKDITGYYDATKQAYVFDLDLEDDEIPAEVTLTVTLQEVNDPNDNDVDDGDFN